MDSKFLCTTCQHKKVCIYIPDYQDWYNQTHKISEEKIKIFTITLNCSQYLEDKPVQRAI